MEKVNREACAVCSEESLRPPEPSSLLDEPLCFQPLHKTVCIPDSPQHCVPVRTGIAEVGAVDFISRTLRKKSPPWTSQLNDVIFVLF